MGAWSTIENVYALVSVGFAPRHVAALPQDLHGQAAAAQKKPGSPKLPSLWKRIDIGSKAPPLLLCEQYVYAYLFTLIAVRDTGAKTVILASKLKG